MSFLSIAKSFVDSLPTAAIGKLFTSIQACKISGKKADKDSPFPDIEPVASRQLTELERLKAQTAGLHVRARRQLEQARKHPKTKISSRVSLKISQASSHCATRPYAVQRNKHRRVGLRRVDGAPPVFLDVRKLNATVEQCVEMKNALGVLHSTIKTELDQLLANRAAVTSVEQAEDLKHDTLSLLAVLSESYPAFDRLQKQFQRLDHDFRSTDPSIATRTIIDSTPGTATVSDHIRTFFNLAPAKNRSSEDVPVHPFPCILPG